MRFFIHQDAGRPALNALNFFTAAMETGFGPFLSVYLTQLGWSQKDVGVTLSIGTIAGLVAQLPAGALVDGLHAKRLAAAGALLVTALSAGALAVWPSTMFVLSAQALHAIAGTVLTPSIAAITLRLCGHAAFGASLGSNARWASLGNAGAAAVLGLVATRMGERTVFLFAAALAIVALAALTLLPSGHRDVTHTDHPALLHPAERRRGPHRPWHIFFELHLHSFAFCIMLFFVANAALAPLALKTLAEQADSGLVISAAIVVPQGVVALLAPWAGRAAERWGRRPLLLVAFAAVPLRALLFALLPGAVNLIGIEILDGIGAAIIGIMIPLIAADLTRQTGYLNLAIASFGLAAALGATISTSLAGWIADMVNPRGAFLALAVIGVAALASLWRIVPETRSVEATAEQDDDTARPLASAGN
jgi:MFS family permease